MPALIGLLLVGAVSLYDLGTASASVPRWGVIYIWAAMALVWWTFQGRDRWDDLDRLALLLWGWAGLSLSWAVDWRQGVYSFVNLSALLAVFLYVRHVPRRIVRYVPEAALVAIVVAFADQYLYPFDWGGHGNRNFQTEAVLVLLALGVGVRTRLGRIAYPFVALASLYLFWFVNPSRIEWWVLLCFGILLTLRFSRGLVLRWLSAGQLSSPSGKIQSDIDAMWAKRLTKMSAR